MKEKTVSSKEKDLTLYRSWSVVLLTIVLLTVIIAFIWLFKKPAVELDLQNLSTIVDR